VRRASNYLQSHGRSWPFCALAEAAARRTERGNNKAGKSQAANETGGRGGLDPTRYGDWEVNGLASDF